MPRDDAGQLLTFRVADERFALPAAQVREVVRLPRVTRVPHAPDSLIGVGNLRGAVLPLVALGALIDRPVVDPKRVIVLADGDPVGIVVDEVSAVVDRGLEGDTRILDLAPLLAGAFSARSTAGRGAVAAPASVETAVEAVSDIVLLAFAVGRQDFALPIAQVEEVIRLPDDITLLPGADDVVLGTVARRGRLLPLLSLQRLLGLAAVETSQRPRVVIVRIGTHRVGLVVDAIRSVLRVDEAMIDAVPEVLSRGQAEAKIQAICRLDDGARLVSILATDHLVQGALTARLLQHKAEEGTDMVAQQAEGTGEQYLIFRLGGQDFGLPIAAVTEVTAVPDKLTRLPKAPAFVEGVMNLRGEVIAVIDQGRRFTGEPAAGKRRRVVVVMLGAMRIGFVVDLVSEVLRIPDAAIRPAPDLGHERTRIFDRIATIAGGEQMVLLVDPQELLDRAEADLLAAFADSGPISEDAARS